MCGVGPSSCVYWVIWYSTEMNLVYLCLILYTTNNYSGRRRTNILLTLRCRLDIGSTLTLVVVYAGYIRIIWGTVLHTSVCH